MAVNESRNLSTDLLLGLTDGVVKKAAPDRGGVVEGAPIDRNAHLHRDLYDPATSIDGVLSADRTRSL